MNSNGFWLKICGLSTLAEGVKAALENNASIVVVCSSDEEYRDILPAITDELCDKVILASEH